MKTKPKLVSLNMGISLVILKDGQEQKISYSLACPSKSFDSVYDSLESMCEFINEEFDTKYTIYDGDANKYAIKIAKPKIKAPAPAISQDEFNKKIKELVP